MQTMIFSFFAGALCAWAICYWCIRSSSELAMKTRIALGLSTGPIDPPPPTRGE